MKPDYSTLIDAETWAFIRATEAQYPTGTLTVAQQRTAYDAMCRAFHAGRPSINVADQTIAGVPCRFYGDGPVTVLYLHGGGFVVGGLDSHDDVCAELAHATGLFIVSADYRLAPEHRHPAHFDDALAVAQAIDGPLILMGDSAGGSLAACVTHRLRDRVLAQVLIYPSLGDDHGGHDNAPMLTRADMAYYAEMRGAAPNDPTANALSDTDFTALPPTVIFTAECDPLASDGPAYRDAILKAGGQATLIEEPGLIHGYLRARHSVTRARDSFARITAALLAASRHPA